MTKIHTINFLLIKLWKFSLSQFDESVIKFYLVKSFSDFDEILVSCAQNIIKFFWWAREKKLLQSILQEVEKLKKLPFLASIT